MLYELNLKAAPESRRISIERPDVIGVNEKLIENFLATHLVELIPEEQLMLLAQERQFQEEADILALDRSGKLFIFELKRWQSSSENLLQVMRYGQKFGRYTHLITHKSLPLYRPEFRRRSPLPVAGRSKWS